MAALEEEQSVEYRDTSSVNIGKIRQSLRDAIQLSKSRPLGHLAAREQAKREAIERAETKVMAASG